MKSSVRADETAITGSRSGHTRSARWDEVKFVFAEKVDKVTYEEIFLIVENEAGSALAIGELDDGFDDIQQFLLDKLRGFPADWYANAEMGDVGNRKLIWSRS